MSFSTVLDELDAIADDTRAAEKFLGDLERLVRQNVEHFDGTFEVTGKALASGAAGAVFHVKYDQGGRKLDIGLPVAILSEDDGFILYDPTDHEVEALEFDNAVSGARWVFEQIHRMLSQTRSREWVAGELAQREEANP